jgi:transcriptional regulator with XRE-family HTH domain
LNVSLFIASTLFGVDIIKLVRNLLEPSMSQPTKAISKIAALREQAGLTQAQLAVFIGVTTNTIQNWENGKSGVEQIEKFLKLCEVLDCNLRDLVEYVPNTNAEEPKAGSFSLEQLRELRQRWGTEKKPETSASNQSYSLNKKQKNTFHRSGTTE